MPEPIVRSLLENDLYKFTMWQAYLHRHPEATAEYVFQCRKPTEIPLARLKEALEAELAQLCRLNFTQEELDYLRGLSYLREDFVDFLSIFRFQRRFIELREESGSLSITASGPIIQVMAFEIPVLYLVNELYFREFGDSEELLKVARQRLQQKIRWIRDEQGGSRPFAFSDFGLRRRFSGAWQEEAVATLAQELPANFRGTSNVFLAMKLGLNPIGTMAHEYLQAHQAFGGSLRQFQKAALESWMQEFRGALGIALTDVVGMDAFLADFDLYLAKLYDGLRHDSGDPYVWGEKALAHFHRLGLDPQNKLLVFSDGLDIPRALALHRHFSDRIPTSFGIGTDLTNDTPREALNIVMKLHRCCGQPVAKLPDAPGKAICPDSTYLNHLRWMFGISEGNMAQGPFTAKAFHSS